MDNTTLNNVAKLSGKNHKNKAFYDSSDYNDIKNKKKISYNFENKGDKLKNYPQTNFAHYRISLCDNGD